MRFVTIAVTVEAITQKYLDQRKHSRRYRDKIDRSNQDSLLLEIEIQLFVVVVVFHETYAALT